MNKSATGIVHNRPVRLLALAALVAGFAFGLLTGTGSATKKRGWIETGHSLVPLEYFQGVTSDKQRRLYFDGPFSGLYRTDSNLVEQARNFNVIPADVNQREGYNHIGDITWDKREGGRVLLPLECFFPFIGNFCRTGSIGVADPETVQWQYYVKLDPAFIDKVMWAEVEPREKLVWTSNGALNGGHDLLAYDLREVTAANAAPGGPLLKPVKVLANAVPPNGITGAAFYKHRLFVAGQNKTLFEVWSIDLRDGSRQLEIQKQVLGESEGLDVVNVLGGKLHWLIAPQGTGNNPPTYGDPAHSGLVHFRHAGGGGWDDAWDAADDDDG
jgi:hypothetical protein